MSVKRRDLIKYFQENGFYLLREGAKHSIYTNGDKTIPIKRHHSFDRRKQGDVLFASLTA